MVCTPGMEKGRNGFVDRGPEKSRVAPVVATARATTILRGVGVLTVCDALDRDIDWRPEIRAKLNTTINTKRSKSAKAKSFT
mmetsp:Transcript_21222/g.56658  ORF Transcript_21222/g.56658 Transcript_21222/m.56658 type:complete len:82 (+) Transcript_21222:249-494(+)